MISMAMLCKQFGIHNNETGTKLAGHNVTKKLCVK